MMYRVTWPRDVIIEELIEADSEAEAIEKASKQWAGCTSKSIVFEEDIFENADATTAWLTPTASTTEETCQN